MRKQTLMRTVNLAVTSLVGLGLAMSLLFLLGAWSGSALAAPLASHSPAPLMNASAGITLVKTAPATIDQAYGAGQTLLPYTLTIQNPNAYAIVGAVVTDVVPAGATLHSGTPATNWTYAPRGAAAGFDQDQGITLSNNSIDVGTYYASLIVPVKDRSVIVNTGYCFSGTVGGAVRLFCEDAPVATTIRAPDFSLAEGAPAPVCAGGRVTFTVAVTNPGGVATVDDFSITGQITPALTVLTNTISDGGVWTPNTISWTVTLPDLDPAGANAVTRTFAVTVPASMAHGTLLTNTYTVTSAEVLPNISLWQSSGVTVTRVTASFTSTSPACQYNQVAFQNNSVGATSFQWNFGDGSPINTQANPTHQYASAGAFTVILTATGQCGSTSATGSVTVNPGPTPVMQIAPNPTQLGVTTYFTDAGSGGASWGWSFGDGATVSGSAVNHTFTGAPAPRWTTVMVTSTGSNGCSSVISSSLQVNPGIPNHVVLSAWPPQPTVGTSAAVTATVTDQWTNPVSDNTPVSFSATQPPPGNPVITPAADLTSGGLAHAVVTSTVAGPVTVRGDAPGGVSGWMVITFTPDVPYTLTCVAMPLNLPVGNGSALTATVVDRFNNAIPGQVITFTSGSNLGSGAIAPQTSLADAQGRAYSMVTSTLPGLKVITATATASVWSTATVNFTVGAPHTITLVAAPPAPIVRNSAALTATVTDRFNNLVVGEVISFTTSDPLGPGGSVTPPTDAADGIGQAHSSVTSISSGPKIIYATASNLVYGTVAVNFQAGPPSSIQLMAVPPTQTVGLVSQLGARAQDQDGNDVSGHVVSFTLTLGLGSLGFITDTTDTGGWAHSSIGSLQPGPNRVVASTSNLITASVVVTFVAGSPSSLALVANPTSLTVGNTSALTATLGDPFGNPLPGYAIAFSTTSPLGFGVLTPLSGTANALGNVTSALSSTLPGIKTVTATGGGLTATAQITFNVGAPASVTLVGVPSMLTAGQTAALTATVTDRFGNPIYNDIVVFSGSGLNAGDFDPLATTTDSNGKAYSDVSTAQAGPHLIQAQETYGGGITGTTVITWTPGPPANLIVIANPASLTVGGASSLTATLSDQYSNPISGQVISFTYSGSLGSGGLNPPTSITNLSGQAFSALSSTVSGPKLATATAPTGLTGTVTITFNASAPRTVTLSAAPPTPTVGTNVTLTALVVDQYTNPVPGQVVTFTYGAPLSLGGLSPIASTTNAAGQATSAVSSTLPSPVPLTATITSGISGTTSITFVVGAPYTMTLVAYPASLQVGSASALTATMYDRYYNRLSGYMISFATTDPLGAGNLAPLSGVTNVAGNATSAISSTVAGVKTVTATSSGLTVTTQVTFTPGAATIMTLVANPNPLPVGDTSTLTATLTDQYGNPVPGHFAMFTSTGNPPDPTGAPTNSSGQANSSISSTLISIVIVTATDFYAPYARGSTVVTFTAGPLVSITVSPSPVALTVGANQMFNAGGYDRYGNPVPVAPTWATNGGSVNPGPSATTVFTAQLTPASGRLVTATLGSISGTAIVNIISGTLTRIVVTLNPVTVTVGTTQQFTATGYDQYNNPLSVMPVWTTNGGSISASGFFTAQTTLASGRLVTATVGSISGTAIVNITAGALNAIIVLPSPITLTAGVSQTFTANGYDPYGNAVPVWPTWTTNGGSVNPGPSVTTVFTAQMTPASGRLVTATQGAISGAAVVNVVSGCVPVSGANFSWNPAMPTTSQVVTFTGSVAGGSLPISYIWNWGNGMPEGTGNPAFHTFTVSGTYTVLMTATNACGLITATRAITATGAPVTPIYGVQLSPDTAAQNGAPGQTVTYTLVLTNTGNTADSFNLARVVAGQAWATTVTPTRTATLPPGGATQVTITVLISATATNGQQSIATITASSVVSVTASDSSVLTTTAVVACVSPSVTALTSNSPVNLGQTMYLTASVTGSTPITYAWNWGDSTSTTGVGLVNASHVYTLGGSFTVTLVAANGCGSNSRALTVTVTYVPGAPARATLVAVPASLPVSSTSTLTATVYDGSDAPLAGQVVTFTTSGALGGGSLRPITATTNAQGRATAVISSTLVGTKRITVTTYNLIAAWTGVTFFGGGNRAYLPAVMNNYVYRPPSLTLVAYPLRLVMSDTTTLTATVLGEDGVPTAGMTVTFSTPDPLGSGALTPFGTRTNASGQITATLRSTVAGWVHVTARASNGLSDTLNLYFCGPGFCAPQVLYTMQSNYTPMGLAYDASRGRLFVANRDSDSVAVLDASTGDAIQIIAGMGGVQGVAFDANRNRIYAVGGNTLYIIDGASYSIIKTVTWHLNSPGDMQAQGVAYNPTADKIYVAGPGDDSIRIVSAADWSILAHLYGPQIAEPSYIAVNPVTNKVYVSNHNYGLPYSWVTVINGSTNQVAASIPLGGDLYGITVDSVHNRVYVASISAARVYAINGGTDTSIGDIQIVRSFDGTPVPLRMVAVNPNAGSDIHLWFTSSTNDARGMDRLILVSGAWPTMGDPLAVEVASSPEGGLLFDPASWYVFASSTGANLVSVSQDSALLCPTPLSLGTGEDRIYTVVHDYQNPK